MAIRDSMFAAGVAGLLAATSGCGSKSGPAPDKDPAAAPSGTATAAMVNAAPSGTATATAAPAATIPFLVKVDAKAPAGAGALYPIDGALMTAAERKVGRIDGDKIEWVGEIPEGGAAFGPTSIFDVVGRWPDAVGAYSQNANGRAAQPTYVPIAWKGRSFTVAEGGGWGTIVGVVDVGKSRIAVGNQMMGPTMATISGPLTPHRGRTGKEYGCTKEEIVRAFGEDLGFAVTPSAVVATDAGSLVTVGPLCEKRGSGAEVWTPDGLKSSVVDLSKMISEAEFSVSMVVAGGDEVWIARAYGKNLVRLVGKTPEAVPAPEGDPVVSVFTSKKREVHIMTERGFYRREGDAWVQIGRRPWLQGYSSARLDDAGNVWARSYGGWDKLGPGDDPREWREDCPTPLVYLYNVSYQNQANFDFPTTRKALSTFAEVGQITLVDFKESEIRMLGVQVSSKAQGEAVIAHVKANMKDEKPRLLCLAPKSPRKVDIGGKK